MAKWIIPTMDDLQNSQPAFEIAFSLHIPSAGTVLIYYYIS